MRNIQMIKLGPKGGQGGPAKPGAGTGGPSLLRKGHTCKVSRGEKCCGGGGKDCAMRDMFSGAKSGGQDTGQLQKFKTIVILDDEALNRAGTTRLLVTGIKKATGVEDVSLISKKIVAVRTVEEAMDAIVGKEISLILLDRKLDAERTGEEVIGALTEQDEAKLDCVAMCTGSPDKLGPYAKELLGEDRIFDKLKEQPQIRALAEHIAGGGRVTNWKKIPATEFAKPESPPAGGEPRVGPRRKRILPKL